MPPGREPVGKSQPRPRQKPTRPAAAAGRRMARPPYWSGKPSSEILASGNFLRRFSRQNLSGNKAEQRQRRTVFRVGHRIQSEGGNQVAEQNRKIAAKLEFKD